MLEFLKKESNTTYTENGAVTNKSTLCSCLDFFATAGALRKADEQEIRSRFMRAYYENPNLAMKILFFSRDIRGGLGERRVFRVILRWLAENEPESLKMNIPRIAEYGRWDDILVLLDTPCRHVACDCIANQFNADMTALRNGGEVSLLGKWMPSINASGMQTVRSAKILAKALGMNDAEYRKALTELRARIRIIENNLRTCDYTFDYSAQPSKAMFKYRAAFIRNDGERYSDFLAAVNRGEKTLNTGMLMPYELIDPYLYKNGFWSGKCFLKNMEDSEKDALNTTWNALPDFSSDENALAVVDTSGSMYFSASPTSASVALSLGLYFAEHSKGAFANHFIEFSENPQLIEIKGQSFADRLRYITSFNEVANTNLEAVFDLILNTAVKYKVPQSELPSKLYIISDMEFDSCVGNSGLTNFENAKRKFEKCGYQLPQIVFWNVASRNNQQPVTVNDRGVALVSGCTPRIFSMVMDGELDPVSYMLSVVNTKRYADIAA